MQLTLGLLSDYEAAVEDSPLIVVRFKSGRFTNSMFVHALDFEKRWPGAYLGT